MKNLKLSKLNHDVLNADSMRSVRGGEECGSENCCCACAYANSGGSSTSDNCSANDKDGLVSVHPDCTSLDW